MYPSTYPKSGKRSYNSDRNNDSERSYRNSDSDIYESEFSRYDDGYDDNYSSPAYSMRSGNYNAGRNTEYDESNPFRRAGQNTRGEWRNTVDDDDEDDYRNDFRNTRDDDEEDDRYMGRYDRNYPDNRHTNSYGSYDRRDTYGRENDRVNSSRGYDSRSPYGSRGYDSNRQYREGGNYGSRNNSYNSGSGRSYDRENASDRNKGYSGYQNSSRKSYSNNDYRDHQNRGEQHRTPYYNDGRHASSYYNDQYNDTGTQAGQDRNRHRSYSEFDGSGINAERWRNHFSW